MLKISVVDSPATRRLVLEGTLIAPWVDELRTAWAEVNADTQGRKLIINLRNVTEISHEGEDAISDLMRQGATFCCHGVLTKHILQQLARKNKKNASAPAPAVQASISEQKELL
ncbi:MAG: hypothetical protein ACP5M4_05690 [Acidobacteriaceae bacterium]